MAPRRPHHRKRSSILSKDYSEDLSDFFSDYVSHIQVEPSEDNKNNITSDDDDKHAKYARQKEDDLNASNSSFPKRAYASFRHQAAISLKSSRVDAVLAAAGCAGSLAFLQFLTDHIPGYEFMGSFLVGSALKFFFNENPPTLEAFVQSSLFAIVAGESLHLVPYFCGEWARSVLLFSTVLYWKLYGGMWTSANTLAMIVAAESGGWTRVVPGMRELKWWANLQDDQVQKHFPWKFLFFPYLSGHLILYVLALLLSIVRRKARTYLIQREFISKQLDGGMDWQTDIVGGKERRERLRKLFNRMDTSGDGTLDVVELQVALRAATGTDISLSDTREILKSVDSDGNGSLDFNEFCASIDKLWPE
jgi:EF-hand domain pair